MIFPFLEAPKRPALGARAPRLAPPAPARRARAARLGVVIFLAGSIWLLLSSPAASQAHKPGQADEGTASQLESAQTSQPGRAADDGVAPAPAPAPPPPTSSVPDGTAPKGPVPPAFPPSIPNLDYGARVRVGVNLQDPNQPTSLRDVSATVDADMYMSGQVHRMFKFLVSATVSFRGAPGTPSTLELTLLDAIARFEPLPALNVYAGRMLVTVDRFGQAGPWGLDEWFYPGIFPGAPLATPKTGPVGRDIGVNLWGAPFGGHVKYYLGAYQLQDPALNPLFSGRLQVSLLSPEPAFFHRNTYYGERDLLSAGLGLQFQAGGSLEPRPAMAPDDFVPRTADHGLLSADLVLEKRLGDAGAITINAAAYAFRGAFRPWESLYIGALGYVFPRVIGVGKLKPSIRLQQAQAAAEGAGLTRVIDAQLTYVVMNWFARLHVNYRRTQIDLGSGPLEGNALLFGIQLWDP